MPLAWSIYVLLSRKMWVSHLFAYLCIMFYQSFKGVLYIYKILTFEVTNWTLCCTYGWKEMHRVHLLPCHRRPHKEGQHLLSLLTWHRKCWKLKLKRLTLIWAYTKKSELWVFVRFHWLLRLHNGLCLIPDNSLFLWSSLWNKGDDPLQQVQHKMNAPDTPFWGRPCACFWQPLVAWWFPPCSLDL